MHVCVYGTFQRERGLGDVGGGHDLTVGGGLGDETSKNAELLLRRRQKA
jgi:hypothetical protein